MVEVREVEVSALDPVRLRPVIGVGRYNSLLQKAEDFRVWVGGTRIWNVNSTATGGGVAEMLQVLVGYSLGLGLDVRWLVAEGDARFFAITKRLHNRIHGAKGDDGNLGESEADHYRKVTRANAESMLRQVRPGDLAILHDPQTAGLGAMLSEAGLRVVWRCHIGADHTNAWTEEAWNFLRPHTDVAELLVFTRRQYVPPHVPENKVEVIPPSIDPFSPKNRHLSARSREQILQRIGVLEAARSQPDTVRLPPGATGRVTVRATVISEGAPIDPSLPLIVQVSRWDRLKDMQGVIQGFAANVGGKSIAELALVGPAVDGVADDPEAAEVLEECTSVWRHLPPATRRRIHLITLPLHDVDENAVMVNAIQSQATVIVQKSLVEGFGLTVAEGMWKSKAVIASAVGGIVDQVVPGTGVLIDDPADLDAFGDALRELLARPDQIHEIGRAARRHVRDNFIGDLHLLRYAALIERLVVT